MFENQTLNKNRVLPSAMILDRLSIECIAKAATKEKIIESCCISSTKLVEQLVKSEPQYSKIVEKMADVYISLSQLLIALPIRDDDLNAAIKRKVSRKLKHNPTLIKFLKKQGFCPAFLFCNFSKKHLTTGRGGAII